VYQSRVHCVPCVFCIPRSRSVVRAPIRVWRRRMCVCMRSRRHQGRLPHRVRVGPAIRGRPAVILVASELADPSSAAKGEVEAPLGSLAIARLWCIQAGPPLRLRNGANRGRSVVAGCRKLSGTCMYACNNPRAMRMRQWKRPSSPTPQSRTSSHPSTGTRILSQSRSRSLRPTRSQKPLRLQ